MSRTGVSEMQDFLSCDPMSRNIKPTRMCNLQQFGAYVSPVHDEIRLWLFLDFLFQYFLGYNPSQIPSAENDHSL